MLVVGLGSSGTRHARLVRQLIPGVKIVALSQRSFQDLRDTGIDRCVESLEEALQFQPQAAVAAAKPIDLPILHLPQMLGLALGIAPKALRLNNHIMSTKKMLSEVALSP